MNAAMVVDEERDRVLAIAQRGNGDRYHVEPVVEILPEGTVAHGRLQVPVRCGEDARIDPHIALAAQPRELAVLEHLQELGLQTRMHLADLVQEDGALIGILELAELPLLGSRERALFEAEELALQELRGQGGAIHLDEGTLAAGRELVQGAGHELLAGAALASDQDGDVRVRHLLDDLAHLAHLGSVPSQDHHLGLVAGPTAQLRDLLLERALLERLLEGQLELFHLEGLAQEVRGPEAHRLDDGARLTVSGQHHHGHVREALLEALEGLETVHARQDHVQGDQIRPGALQAPQGLLPARKCQDLVAASGHQGLQVVSDAGIVVDDQDAEGLAGIFVHALVDRSYHDRLDLSSRPPDAPRANDFPMNCAPWENSFHS
jgi:hypothetical protein